MSNIKKYAKEHGLKTKTARKEIRQDKIGRRKAKRK